MYQYQCVMYKQYVCIHDVLLFCYENIIILWKGSLFTFYHTSVLNFSLITVLNAAYSQHIVNVNVCYEILSYKVHFVIHSITPVCINLL